MKKYDVIVVGAGIVGLAVAREILLRRPAASLAIVEREAAVSAHQTGHNSGVIHSGIYYAPGSLKARLCVSGSALMYEYAQEHGIPFRRCGKLIVALDDDELIKMDELERRGRANGVPGLRRVQSAEIADIEPSANGVAALHSPNTGITDYTEVSRAIQAELERLGAEFLFETEVRDVAEGLACRVDTNAGSLSADRVITCAGLWSDRLARRSGADPDPRIVPFRGVYLRLRSTEQPVVQGMVYPVPDPSLPFLGVHVTPDMAGDVLLGPTAMVVPSRDAYRFWTIRLRDVWETATWPGTWKVGARYWRTALDEVGFALSRRAYVAAAARYVPGLTVADLDPSFRSGVRAQAVGRDGALVDDFVISQSDRVAHVRNAPSPAATSAFSLARELVDRVGFANSARRESSGT